MQQSPYVALISLVHFDQETNALRTNLKQMQQEMDALQVQHQQLEHAVTDAQQQLHDARKEVDAHELEMKSLEDNRMQKVAQLEAAATPREHQALRKEVDAIAYKQTELEQKLVTLWNVVDQRRRAVETRTKSMQDERANLDTALQEKQRAAQDLQERIAGREHEWGSLAHALPDDLLQKYTMMRMAIANPVAPIEQDACGVCFHSLTRNEMSMARQQHLLQCKGCFRFLYYPQPS